MAVDVEGFEADVMDVDQVMHEAIDTNEMFESASTGSAKMIWETSYVDRIDPIIGIEGLVGGALIGQDA